MKRIELLSPAGDFDSLVAAVRCGADAVYLGMGEFNARRNAKNFTKESFADAARYLRVRGVKAYVALNTLIRDDELCDAVELATFTARAGANGFIVQDIGLATQLKKALPDIALHASTQMSANSPDALPYLKALGFERVVTPREFSREQLANMCRAGKALGIEIETFVHGALCVCLSGQCYLSAAIGGRSANRGMCAGSCRLPFGVNSPQEYALSLKDLSLIDYIDEMQKMGVASLKIEGRMKDAEYVAAATAVCRAAVDGKEVDENLKTQLGQIFSRSGFTQKYFSGKGDSMMGVRTAADNKISNQVKASIHSLYRLENGRVELDGSFTLKRNLPCELTLTDGQNTVTAKGAVPDVAVNKPITEQYALQKLKKSGDTPFVIKNIECNIDDGLIISASALGELRREAILKIEQQRAKAKPVRVLPIEKYWANQKTPQSQKIYLRLERADISLENVKVDAVIIPAGQKTDFCGEIIAEIPRRLLKKEEILKRLEISRENGAKTALCNNIQSVQIARNAGFNVIYGWFMNVFNSHSLEAAKQNGAEAAVLSFELMLSQAQGIKGEIERGIIVYGRLPLMLNYTCPNENNFKGCAQKGCNMELVDRTGAKFPVLCADGARELLNSRPLWMADCKKDFAEYDFAVLYCTTENQEEINRIIEDYRNGNAYKGEFTRGLYYRGVK